MNYTLPTQVALCPECDGQLVLEVDEWEALSRKPTEAGCMVSCWVEKDALDRLICNEIDRYTFKRDYEHQGMFNVWIDVRVEVEEWAIAHIRVSKGENKHGGHNLKVVNWGRKNKKDSPNYRRNNRRFTR